MSTIRFLSFTLVAVLASTIALTADYYVDNAVSTSGNGSIDSPFKTIQEGIDQLSPGDLLWIRGDAGGRSYSETPNFGIPGTESQPITIKAFPGEQVVLTGTSDTRLDIDKDYWIFDGLIIDQAGITRDAVKINASHITIRNTEIRNGQREGISIEDASSILIEDSYIHNFMRFGSDGSRQDAHCIMIDTDRSPTITDIRIYRSTIERCSGDGIQIFGVTGQDISTYAKNIEIVDNIFLDGTTESGLTENALDFKAGDTVLVKGNTMTGYKNNKTIVVQKGCRGIAIEENTISGGLSGIEMRQEGGANFIQENQRVVRNVIYDMSSYALKFDGVRGLTVLNNTLANIGDDSFRFESSLGSSTPAVEGVVIKNNLVYMAAGAPSGTARLSNVDLGYNGWFGASAGGLGQGTDTVGSDPLFVDSSAGNHNLQSGSPAIDVGTPVGLVFVGSAPDLGALETDSGGSTEPPSAPSGLDVN